MGGDPLDQRLQDRGGFADHRQIGTLDHVAGRVEVDRHHLVAGTDALQVLDRPGNPHGHIDPRRDPDAGRADLALAPHKAIVHCHPRGAFGGAQRRSGLVEQRPVLHAVAARENKFGLGHGDLRRVDRHRTQILNPWQVADQRFTERQRPHFMAGFADRLGAFHRRQNQAWRLLHQVFPTGTRTPTGQALGHLPDPCGRALAELGGQAATQFTTTAAAVRQQPMARRQLPFYCAEGQHPCFRGIAVEIVTSELQQAIHTVAVEGAFLVLTKDHRHHRAVAAGEFVRQA